MNVTFSGLYFTRCGNAKDKKSGCHVYLSNRAGSGFSNPELVNLGGDSTSIIGHATVSENEKVIIFSADFPEGFGGKDLYMVTKGKTSGDFGMPKNLGATINTPGDELYPFLRHDSILYFASTGLPGFGGLDIFYSTIVDERWTVPENMGYPMNSFKDDFGIVFNLDAEEEGFFSSGRKEKKAYTNAGFCIIGLCNNVPATKKAKVVFCNPTSIPMVIGVWFFSFMTFEMKYPNSKPVALNNKPIGSNCKKSFFDKPAPPDPSLANNLIAKTIPNNIIVIDLIKLKFIVFNIPIGILI